MIHNNYIDIDLLRNNITIYIYTSPYVVNIAKYISKILSFYNVKNYVICSLVSNEHIDIVNNNTNSFIFFVAFQSFLNSSIRNNLLRLKKKNIFCIN